MSAGAVHDMIVTCCTCWVANRIVYIHVPGTHLAKSRFWQNLKVKSLIFMINFCKVFVFHYISKLQNRLGVQR